jgi:polar amino acid transport system substrate-binding protein
MLDELSTTAHTAPYGTTPIGEASMWTLEAPSARRTAKPMMLVAALLLVVAAAGCSAKKDTAAAGAGGGGKLADIVKNKKVRVADCLSFAPFGYKDAAGAPIGYDVDIANLIAKALGDDVKLELSDTTSVDRIPKLKTDKVDIVICNFTANTTRAKEITFTDPYVVAGELLLVKKGSPIKGVSDLGGKKVAVVKGSTNAEIVKKATPSAVTQEYDTSADAVTAVKAGQADAMIEDSNFQNYQVKINPDLAVTSDSLIPLEYNSFGIRQGEPDLLNWLNLFLKNLNRSGENAALYEKHFGVKPAFPLNPQY